MNDAEFALKIFTGKPTIECVRASIQEHSFTEAVQHVNALRTSNAAGNRREPTGHGDLTGCLQVGESQSC